MAKEFAKAFYKSAAWINCRKAYAASVGGLCEECLRRGIYNPGKIVHHKIKITPENITEPTITLNWDNLELLCRDCHALEHPQERKRRYNVDKYGRIIPKSSRSPL